MTGRGCRLTRYLRLALLVLLTGWCWPVASQVPDKINYQGKLTNPGGQAINGPVSMVFKLYSGPSGGSALYTETQTVTVANGIFNVAIGSVTPLALPFNIPYYLGITVGTDAEMIPREAVLTSPYAFQAVSATSATTAATAQGLAAAGAVTILSGGTRVLQLQSMTGSGSTNTVNVLGGSPLNTISAGVVAATIAGGGGTLTLATAPNSVLMDYGTVSGGLGNTASNVRSAVAGGSFNTASGYGSVVGGGASNTASGFESTVGGGAGNIAGGLQGSTIAGGQINAANGVFSTVGGGVSNIAGGHYSTVAGGLSNTASGDYSFAAGRFANTQTAGASPTVHSGAFVWADGNGFDFNSSASNEFAARATGGVRFVTAIDDSGNPTQTVAINTNGEMNFGNTTRQMLKLWDQPTSHYGIGVQSRTIYFRTDDNANFAWFAGGSHSDTTFDPGSGGTVLMTLMPSNLATVPTGIARAQSFLSVSDRNAKANFAPIDARAVLERVLSLPVSTWVYRTDPSTPHIGPVSQDFHAAFGVGSDDKTINTIDEGGVAFGAIQGLNAKLEERLGEKDREIAALKQGAETSALKQVAEIAALKQQVAELAALKQQVEQLVRLQGKAAVVAALDASPVEK